MLASLAKLVDNLPNEKFFLLENYFEKLGHSAEKVSLLKQKGHYPYSYFNSFEKLRETRLPPRAMWKNSLTGGDVSVSRSEYNHALKVFTELKCGSLGDYHDLYLTTDVLFYCLLPFSKLFGKFAIKHTGWIVPVTSRQVTFPGTPF